MRVKSNRDYLAAMRVAEREGQSRMIAAIPLTPDYSRRMMEQELMQYVEAAGLARDDVVFKLVEVQSSYERAAAAVPA